MQFLAVAFHGVYASVELPNVWLAEKAVVVPDYDYFAGAVDVLVVAVDAAAAAGSDVSENVAAVASEAAVVTLAAPGLEREDAAVVEVAGAVGAFLWQL